MVAYVVAEVQVSDPVGYEEYKRLAQESIALHGGRYIARGGETVGLEGPPPARMVILEFPSLERARTWFASPEYAAARAARATTATARLVAVAGLP